MRRAAGRLAWAPELGSGFGTHSHHRPRPLCPSAHPGVAKVAFTGSTATGRSVYASAAANLRPAVLELGGKSALLIFSDADVDKAVEWAMFGCFWTVGQVSILLLLHAPLHPQGQCTAPLRRPPRPPAPLLHLAPPHPPIHRSAPPPRASWCTKALPLPSSRSSSGAQRASRRGARACLTCRAPACLAALSCCSGTNRGCLISIRLRRQAQIGDPLSPDCRMGALVSEAQYKKVGGWVGGWVGGLAAGGPMLSGVDLASRSAKPQLPPPMHPPHTGAGLHRGSQGGGGAPADRRRPPARRARWRVLRAAHRVYWGGATHAPVAGGGVWAGAGR